MARGINRMFSLTKKIPLTLLRPTGGHWNDMGLWVEGQTTPVPIEANVQPFKHSQTYMLPESERTRQWLNVMSTSEIRKMEDGDNGWEADTFIYQGERYKVMAVSCFKMGVLDHYHAKASLDSPTPEG